MSITTAMILAAGRGERMRPLTDSAPKPMLEVAAKPLIEYHVAALVSAGVQTIIINTAHLGYQIREYLGDGSRYGCEIIYSLEPIDGGLETAGGIIQALPFFQQPFIVVNADVYCDIDFSQLSLPQNKLAHLVCVNNPEHNPAGDLFLNNGILQAKENDMPTVTFAGIAVYHPNFFAGEPAGRSRLLPLIKKHMIEQKVSGELYTKLWHDVGTVSRLQQINQLVAAS